jgi:hypothetical protein
MSWWRWLQLLRRHWQDTSSMPFRLLIPLGLVCVLLPLHHGAPGPDGTAPDPAHYRWRGPGSRSLRLGSGKRPPGPFPSLHPRTPTLTCSGPAAGPSAEIILWFPFSVLCLVLSPAWFCVLAPYLISHPSNQGASQGHVLPRLRQLPGKCLSLRWAETSHLWWARHLGQVEPAWGPRGLAGIIGGLVASWSHWLWKVSDLGWFNPVPSVQTSAVRTTQLFTVQKSLGLTWQASPLDSPQPNRQPRMRTWGHFWSHKIFWKNSRESGNSTPSFYRWAHRPRRNVILPTVKTLCSWCTLYDWKIFPV